MMPARALNDTVVELATGPVFFRDSGGIGVPVVLLHAASGNSLMWEHQVPALTAAGYRVLAIDYRGVNGKPGACDWSDQIDALVVHLGIERFHLLGTAAGGGAAFQYTLGFGAKVRSLIVANSHGNVADKDYVEMGKRIRPSPQFDHLPLEVRELGPSYRAAHPEGVARWLALSAREHGAENVSARAQGEAGHTERFVLRPERTVTWEKLEVLQLPTLLITGDADLYTPPSVLRMFLRHMRSAESAVIPETGHSSYWENPDVFNETLLTFLSKQ